jgi:hypothetical protein
MQIAGAVYSSKCGTGPRVQQGEKFAGCRFVNEIVCGHAAHRKKPRGG